MPEMRRARRIALEPFAYFRSGRLRSRPLNLRLQVARDYASVAFFRDFFGVCDAATAAAAVARSWAGNKFRKLTVGSIIGPWGKRPVSVNICSLIAP